MSQPRPADPVNLVMSLLAADVNLIREALVILAENCGEPDFISAYLNFDYTDYYGEEMGSNLIRRFVSFAALIPPETLPDVKGMTNGVEGLFVHGGKRRLNIDPGYLSSAHLILATGKGFAHRPYLREGVYADLTLIFRQGTFRSLPWTYPDYGSPEVMGILERIRNRYLEKIRTMRKRPS